MSKNSGVLEHLFVCRSLLYGLLVKLDFCNVSSHLRFYVSSHLRF
jgi:hypothetical protein